MTITGGLPSTVTRDSGLTISWVGGNPSDWVELSGVAQGSSAHSFACFGSAADGKMPVPAAVLDQLTTTGNNGTLIFTTGPNASFTAPLTAGGALNGNFPAPTGSTNTTVTYK